LLLVAVTLLTVLAWIALVSSHDGAAALHDVGAPHRHPAGAGALVVAGTMWMVMMVAMMLPPVLPWILLFSEVGRLRGGARSASGTLQFPTALFAGGYFAVWGAFSLAAAAGQLWLQRAALLDPQRLALAPALGGALWIVAGLFQLSPLKAACLRHCRTPLGILLASWSPGPGAALRLGLRHGAYCLGCCWALMALSFALGVMNLAWMAFLTVFLCVEKIAPAGELASRAFGLFGLGWGLALLL
jgi:predicted metal-binding membrane protein